MASEEKDKKKFSRHLDKIVMGAIIGGAVLSVIGARRLVKKKHEAEQNPSDIETAPKPKKKGLFRRLLGL